jgi:dTDP-4-dehydrorhamnose 3,5-epimerase
MKFEPTRIPGAVIIDIEPIEDDRGFFARTFCRQEFEQHGLSPHIAQCSISFNRKRGTLRGMHYQAAPHEEAKLVRCTRGSLYDVIVDLRPTSPAFRKWISVELSGASFRMLYVPEGVAHGYLTLEDDTEVFYQVSENYAPQYTRGVRWDDPAFGIEWPLPVAVIAQRDRSYPDFDKSNQQ